MLVCFVGSESVGILGTDTAGPGVHVCIISLCSRQGGFPQSSTVRDSEQNLCDFGLDVAGEGPSVPPAFVAVGILWQVSHGLTIESVTLPPESSWVRGAPEHILISVDFYRQKCLFLSGMTGYFGYFGGSKKKKIGAVDFFFYIYKT